MSGERSRRETKKVDYSELQGYGSFSEGSVVSLVDSDEGEEAEADFEHGEGAMEDEVEQDDNADEGQDSSKKSKGSPVVHSAEKGVKKIKASSSSSSSFSSSSSSSRSKKASKAGESIAIPSVDKVLAAVRKDRSTLRKQISRGNLVDDSVLDGVTEVKDLDTVEVSDRIEQLVVNIVTQIMNGKNAFDLDIPSRAASNQKYIEGLDRVCLGDKVSKRSFLNTAHVRKTAITTRVIELCHEVLAKQIHITKRDLFYTDVKLFQDQLQSDAVLDDVACMVGCTRTSLHVVASDKGLVVGRIQYKEAGDEIDCTKMGIGGKAIPPYIDKITDIRSDAEFIILVEKEAAYMRLAEDRIYNKYPAIIITGKGQPDVATRLFLRKIRDQLKIPILALVDSDPYGLKILSVYTSGSKAMSYDSSNLTTSDIKWLGVRPSDLDKYNLPAQCRLPLTDTDRKMGEELLKEEFIQKNPEWVKELKIMLRSGEKAEIQALSSFGFQYITETFLPRKLLEGDWI